MPREKSEEEKVFSVPGFSLRVGISIVSFFALIVFMIIWLFFSILQLFTDSITWRNGFANSQMHRIKTRSL